MQWGNGEKFRFLYNDGKVDVSMNDGMYKFKSEKDLKVIYKGAEIIYKTRNENFVSGLVYLYFWRTLSIILEYVAFYHSIIDFAAFISFSSKMLFKLLV